MISTLKIVTGVVITTLGVTSIVLVKQRNRARKALDTAEKEFKQKLDAARATEATLVSVIQKAKINEKEADAEFTSYLDKKRTEFSEEDSAKAV